MQSAPPGHTRTPLTGHNTIILTTTPIPIGTISNIISMHVEYVEKVSMLHISKLGVGVHHAHNANLRSIAFAVAITINNNPFLFIFANTRA